MNICFVLDDSIYRHAGVQIYILTFADWLLRHNHSVTVFHAPNPSVSLKPIDKRIKVVKISQGFDIKGLSLNGSVSPFPGFADAKIIEAKLKEAKFDVIHFSYPFSPFVSGRVLKVVKKLRNQGLKVKTVAALQIYAEEKLLPRISNKLLGLLVSQRIKIIDTFIYNSQPSFEYGRKYLGVKSEYIPIGLINEPVAKKDNSGSINILFMGRHEERKGVIDLIKALGRLKGEIDMDKLHIYIAGDGPVRAQAEDLAKQLGLQIKFLGRVSEDEKLKLYKQAHIAVFPAKFGESFGIVLIEAMNHSCSIIGYANPGYSDTMGPFAKECLVDIGNITELANTIKSFVNNREEKIFKLGSELKDFFNTKYDIDIICKNLIEIYKN